MSARVCTLCMYVCVCFGLCPRQVEVKGKFYNAAAGEVVQTSRPNRLQSQKHQINSLAFQVRVCVCA